MSDLDIYYALGRVYSLQSPTASFRKAVIDDITTYAPAGGGTGAGSVNIYDTLIGSDSRDFRDVQAAQQYANMARRAQLNYSITLGTSPNWLGNIAWQSDVSTILDTVKSAAGSDYSIALYSAAAAATYSAISQMYSGGRNRWSNVYPYTVIPYDATGGLLENDLYGQVYNTILELISILVYRIPNASGNIYLDDGILGYLKDNYSQSDFGANIATEITTQIRNGSYSADLPSPGYTIEGVDSWYAYYARIDTAIYKILERLGALESRIQQIESRI